MLWQTEDNQAMVAHTGLTPHRATGLRQVDYNTIGTHTGPPTPHWVRISSEEFLIM